PQSLTQFLQIWQQRKSRRKELEITPGHNPDESPLFKDREFVYLILLEQTQGMLQGVSRADGHYGVHHDFTHLYCSEAARHCPTSSFSQTRVSEYGSFSCTQQDRMITAVFI